MTAPTSFNTPDRIIRMAMMDAGFLQDGDDPSPEQYANNLNRLNDLINLWQTQGLKVWLQNDLTVPLVAGQALYTLGIGGSVDMVKPMRVIDGGYYLDTNNVKRPINMISRDEYTRLSNVTQAGAVTSYFVSKERDFLKVYLWLVPTATEAMGTVHLTIQKQVTNLISLSDTMDFPQEWFIALRWGLADDICTGQPQSIMDRCAIKANTFRSALEEWDVEDANTLFQPDHRISSFSGSFR